MMMKIIVGLLISALAATSLAGAYNLSLLSRTNQKLAEIALIEPTTSYGLAHPLLNKHNWSTVSVDGNDVKIYTPDCQLITKTLEELSESERESITLGRKLVKQNISSDNYHRHVFHEKNTIDESHDSLHDKDLEHFQSRSVFFIRWSSDQFIFASSKLLNDLAVVALGDGLLTLMTKGEQILMKPLECATQEEQQVLANVRAEISRWRGDQTQGVVQMQRLMAEMQKNVQQMQTSLIKINQRMQDEMQELNERMEDEIREMSGQMESEIQQTTNHMQSDMQDTNQKIQLEMQEMQEEMLRISRDLQGHMETILQSEKDTSAGESF